jgi:hypothetical protein
MTTLPLVADSDMALPLMVLPSPSRRRITMKPGDVPSAGTGPSEFDRARNTSDCSALAGPGVCPASRSFMTFRFGDPSPTWAKSLPMEAGELNAAVPARG